MVLTARDSGQVIGSSFAARSDHACNCLFNLFLPRVFTTTAIPPGNLSNHFTVGPGIIIYRRYARIFIVYCCGAARKILRSPHCDDNNTRRYVHVGRYANDTERILIPILGFFGRHGGRKKNDRNLLFSYEKSRPTI